MAITSAHGQTIQLVVPIPSRRRHKPQPPVVIGPRHKMFTCLLLLHHHHLLLLFLANVATRVTPALAASSLSSAASYDNLTAAVSSSFSTTSAFITNLPSTNSSGSLVGSSSSSPRASHDDDVSEVLGVDDHEKTTLDLLQGVPEPPPPPRPVAVPPPNLLPVPPLSIGRMLSSLAALPSTSGVQHHFPPQRKTKSKKKKKQQQQTSTHNIENDPLLILMRAAQQHPKFVLPILSNRLPTLTAIRPPSTVTASSGQPPANPPVLERMVAPPVPRPPPLKAAPQLHLPPVVTPTISPKSGADTPPSLVSSTTAEDPSDQHRHSVSPPPLSTSIEDNPIISSLVRESPKPRRTILFSPEPLVAQVSSSDEDDIFGNTPRQTPRRLVAPASFVIESLDPLYKEYETTQIRAMLQRAQPLPAFHTLKKRRLPRSVFMEVDAREGKRFKVEGDPDISSVQVESSFPVATPVRRKRQVLLPWQANNAPQVRWQAQQAQPPQQRPQVAATIPAYQIQSLLQGNAPQNPRFPHSTADSSRLPNQWTAPPLATAVAASPLQRQPNVPDPSINPVVPPTSDASPFKQPLPVQQKQRTSRTNNAANAITLPALLAQHQAWPPQSQQQRPYFSQSHLTPNAFIQPQPQAYNPYNRARRIQPQPTFTELQNAYNPQSRLPLPFGSPQYSGWAPPLRQLRPIAPYPSPYQNPVLQQQQSPLSPAAYPQQPPYPLPPNFYPGGPYYGPRGYPGTNVRQPSALTPTQKLLLRQQRQQQLQQQQSFPPVVQSFLYDADPFSKGNFATTGGYPGRVPTPFSPYASSSISQGYPNVGTPVPTGRQFGAQQGYKLAYPQQRQYEQGPLSISSYNPASIQQQQPSQYESRGFQSSQPAGPGIFSQFSSAQQGQTGLASMDRSGASTPQISPSQSTSTGGQAQSPSGHYSAGQSGTVSYPKAPSTPAVNFSEQPTSSRGQQQTSGIQSSAPAKNVKDSFSQAQASPQFQNFNGNVPVSPKPAPRTNNIYNLYNFENPTQSATGSNVSTISSTTATPPTTPFTTTFPSPTTPEIISGGERVLFRSKSTGTGSEPNSGGSGGYGSGNGRIFGTAQESGGIGPGRSRGEFTLPIIDDPKAKSQLQQAAANSTGRTEAAREQQRPPQQQQQQQASANNAGRPATGGEQQQQSQQQRKQQQQEQFSGGVGGNNPATGGYSAFGYGAGQPQRASGTGSGGFDYNVGNRSSTPWGAAGRNYIGGAGETQQQVTRRPDVFQRGQIKDDSQQQTGQGQRPTQSQTSEEHHRKHLPHHGGDMPFYSQSEVDKHHQRVSHHAQNAKDSEFENDSRILSWYLLRAKEELRQRKAEQEHHKFAGDTQTGPSQTGPGSYGQQSGTALSPSTLQQGHSGTAQFPESTAYRSGFTGNSPATFNRSAQAPQSQTQATNDRGISSLQNPSQVVQASANKTAVYGSPSDGRQSNHAYQDGLSALSRQTPQAKASSQTVQTQNVADLQGHGTQAGGGGGPSGSGSGRNSGRAVEQYGGGNKQQTQQRRKRSQEDRDFYSWYFSR